MAKAQLEHPRYKEWASIDKNMVCRGSQIVLPLLGGEVPNSILRQTLSQIGETLRLYGQNDSWGTVLVTGEDRGMNSWPVPTVVLGFPSPPPSDEIKRKEWHLPVQISQTTVELSGWGAPTSWRNSPVEHRDVFNVGPQSLGISSDLAEARSFGGFLRTASGRVVGLTCSHVLPNADVQVGADICSPSAVEVTSRVDNIARYTNHDPAGDSRSWKNPARQVELDKMLARYHETPSVEGLQVGTSLLGRAAPVILSGWKLGTILASVMNCAGMIMKRHNLSLGDERVEGFALPGFSVINPDLGDMALPSRMDWCVFTVDPER